MDASQKNNRIWTRLDDLKWSVIWGEVASMRRRRTHCVDYPGVRKSAFSFVPQWLYLIKHQIDLRSLVWLVQRLKSHLCRKAIILGVSKQPFASLKKILFLSMLCNPSVAFILWNLQANPFALNTAKLNRALVCFVLVSSSVWRPGNRGLEDMHWENSLRAVQSRGCRYESKHCPRAALTALVNNKPAKCYVYLLLCWENQVFRLSGKCWGRCAEV